MPDRYLRMARIFVAAGCLAWAATPTFALAAPDSGSGTVSTAQQKHAKPIHAERRRVAGQVACTPFGCQRIPPNCHPKTTYYWNGDPTGFDGIACR